MNSIGFRIVKNAIFYASQYSIFPTIPKEISLSLTKFIASCKKQTSLSLFQKELPIDVRNFLTIPYRTFNSQSIQHPFKSIAIPLKPNTLMQRTATQFPKKTTSSPSNTNLMNQKSVVIRRSYHSKSMMNQNFLEKTICLMNVKAIKNFVLGSTIIGSFRAYTHFSSAYAKDQVKLKLLSLDELTTLARGINCSLPEKKETETFEEYRSRCEQFCFEIVFQLCENSEWRKFDSIDKDFLHCLTDKWGRSLLLAAAQQGSAQCIETLLKKGVALSRTDAKGNTPLHLATERGNIEAVEILCRPFFNQTNAQKETALHVAIRCDKHLLIESLLNNGIPENARCKFEDQKIDAFTLAVVLGKRECFDTLVTFMQKPDFKKKYGTVGNILHVALNRNQLDMFRHLLNKYHNQTIDLVNQGDDDLERTPLHIACSKGFLEEIEYLVKVKNADFNKLDSQERTPAHWAVLGACNAKENELKIFLETINMLSYLKIPLDMKDKKELRPEDYIDQSSCKDAVIIKNTLNYAIAQLGKMIRPDFPKFPPEFLVLPGGGPKGIALIGFLEVLKEKGLLSDTRWIAATSAGAIPATLLAIGYSPEQLKDILFNFDLKSLLDPKEENKTLLEGILKSAKSKKLGPLLSTLLKENFNNLIKLSPMDFFDKLLKLEGLCKGDALRKWIDDLIAAKVSEITKQPKEKWINLTFGELENLINQGKFCKHISLYATQVERELTTLNFRSTDPRFKDATISSIATASAAIPGVFVPQVIYYKDSKTGQIYAHTNSPRLLDGGLLKNVADDAFDYEEFQTSNLEKDQWNRIVSNPRTLVASLHVEKKLDGKEGDREIKGIFDLILAVAQVFYYSENIRLQESEFNRNRVVEIPIQENIGLLDFDVSDKDKLEMIQRGRKAAEESPILQKKNRSNS